jgi:hypothetical protein
VRTRAHPLRIHLGFEAKVITSPGIGSSSLQSGISRPGLDEGRSLHNFVRERGSAVLIGFVVLSGRLHAITSGKLETSGRYRRGHQMHPSILYSLTVSSVYPRIVVLTLRLEEKSKLIVMLRILSLPGFWLEGL